MGSDIRVICCGNVLASDDGVGPAIAKELTSMTVPGNVEVIDAGTSGLAILDMILGARKVIIVDATATGVKPGTVQRLTLNQLSAKDLHEASLHDLSFIEALRMGSEVLPEQMPKHIVIVGIEAESTIKPRVGLSRCVEEAIPEALSVIMQEMHVSE